MNKNKNKGQALIAGMALLVIAGLVFFFIFDSSRAVNEKINLVNAADASAYSGAQIAARQLNFMAYTNRVMVANEVAVGHMVSYQAEVETVTNGFANMGGLVGSALDATLNFFGAMVGVSTQSAATWAQDFVRTFTGAYVLGVSANNATYSEFIKTEYDALLGINGQQPIVQNAMEVVAQQYISRPSITISLNSTEGFEALQDSPDPAISGRATSALSPQQQLCQLVIFATPTNVGNGAGVSEIGNGNGNGNGNNPMFGHCTAIINSNGNANVKGSRDNPYDDAGIMLDVLERSSQAVTSADWINDRNMDYDWAFGWDAQRRGSTTLEWDDAEDQYNWTGGDDTLRIRSDIFGIVFSMSGDSKDSTSAYEMAQAGEIDMLQRTMMESAGICDDIDCSTLDDAGASYEAIQSYPRINPFSNGVAVVTAVLTQSGRCNDEWGVDEFGNPIDGFQNDLNRFGNPCDEPASVTAVSSAEVFYRSPGGASSESANLFNPFWQARLLQ